KQAYKVSPTFQKVAPYLEGPLGQNWQKLCGCGDIPAAFFIWAFRDAVAAAGYYTDGQNALDFYQKMGNEINQACENGTLNCRPRFFSLVPPWHKEYNSLLLPTWLSVLQRIIRFSDFSADTDGMLSRGSSEIVFLYKVVTHDKLLTGKPDVSMKYPEFRNHLNKEKVRILKDIGVGYQKVIPPLFILSLLLFFFMAGRSLIQRRFSLLCVAAGASLVGILSISFILTLLTITSYSEIERAMHSAYPMVLFFISAVFVEITGCKGGGSILLLFRDKKGEKEPPVVGE
ncbi:MAG: hypothetical protein D3922_00210, partial [Candidatus Electrothrix sp. AR1]|nr:hypothetical protein [Candidatus Electrothrix sp. AR1]